MADKLVSARQRQRADTASGWVAANSVLLAGEFGFEWDTGKIKIGDGANTWSALDYFTGQPGPQGPPVLLIPCDTEEDAYEQSLLDPANLYFVRADI